MTLRKNGNVRGCVGTLRGDRSLDALVSRMAVAAATKDPRVPPVSEPELRDITIEIALVTLPRPVESPEQVTVGTDGVVLGKNGHQAVFLPEVATEQGWNREQLLDHLCEKAGLPTDCWHRGVALSTFHAEVFAERR